MLYYAKLTKSKLKCDVLNIFQQANIDAELVILDSEIIQKLDGCIYYQLKDNLIQHEEQLTIDSLSSLGKNNREIAKELQWFNLHRIPLRILDLPITLATSNPLAINTALMEVYLQLAQKEISNTKQGQQEGISNARKLGRPLGRGKTEYPANWELLYLQWKNEEISSKEFIAHSGLKKGTFYNLLKEYRTQLSKNESEDSKFA